MLKYAEVTTIDSQDATVGGFLRGQQVSRHRATITCVYFRGGLRFYSLGQKAEDGSVIVQGLRVEVGDRFRLMTLPCGTVTSIHPEKITHLPARDLVRTMTKN